MDAIWDMECLVQGHLCPGSQTLPLAKSPLPFCPPPPSCSLCWGLSYALILPLLLASPSNHLQFPEQTTEKTERKKREERRRRKREKVRTGGRERGHLNWSLEHPCPSSISAQAHPSGWRKGRGLHTSLLWLPTGITLPRHVCPRKCPCSLNSAQVVSPPGSPPGPLQGQELSLVPPFLCVALHQCSVIKS